ncbi:AraC family transcriptional regulator [Paenibacillus sp. HWE-109]|uniref:AraC family transcriptional regulator n=1 Tax=Paenibacillus sp. HWE-109 TaxID=1306526 RepID=UPI001EDFFCC8|nr:AraC family transcriptional regulator [Paenibacillus sp. HWE-109]UKS28678.1 AraC family transcriptional regulator [Paenibacillus sp. HWE-109]
MQVTNPLLAHKLSELKVKMLHAKLSVCSKDWKRFNFVPDYNKFYYICEGEGWIQLDDKLYQPQAGQLFFAPAGVLQSFSATNAAPFTMYWCHFTSNLSFHHILRSLGLPHILAVDSNSRLVSCFEHIIDNCKQPGLTSPIKIQAALLELISAYIDQGMKEDHVTVQFAAWDKLIETIKYIDANLHKEMTIQELSQTAHFHPNYFIRFFKAHLGVPPMRYIHDRRLEKAKELLVIASLTVNEVAHMTGFQDASHFSTSFKKHVGMSPSEFRATPNSPN